MSGALSWRRLSGDLIGKFGDEVPDPGGTVIEMHPTCARDALVRAIHPSREGETVMSSPAPPAACLNRAQERSWVEIVSNLAKVFSINSGLDSRYTSKFCRNYHEIWGEISEITRKNLGALRTKLFPKARHRIV